eukprot:403376867
MQSTTHQEEEQKDSQIKPKISYENVRRLKPEEFYLLEQAEQEAGWGNLKGEDKYYYEANPDAFFCYEEDGKILGFITAFPYNDNYAFLGKVLWDTAVATLEQRNIAFDGAELVQPVYNSELQIQNLSEIEWKQVLYYDQTVFGFDRSNVLKVLFDKPDIFSKIAVQDNQIVGYGIIKKTLDGNWYIGPLSVDNFEIADQIFLSLCESKENQKVYIVVEEAAQNGMELVQKYQMKKYYDAARMQNKGVPKEFNYEKIYFNMSMAFN